MARRSAPAGARRAMAVLCTMGLVHCLPTDPKAQENILIEAAEPDDFAEPVEEGDCMDRVIVDPNCAFDDPPIMRPPVYAKDDDRPRHLDVSWQVLPDRFGITQYQLQESVDDADFATVYHGLNLTWSKNTFNREVKTVYKVKAFNCRGGYNTEWSLNQVIEPDAITDAPRQPRIVAQTFNTVTLKWFRPVDPSDAMITVQYRKGTDAPNPMNKQHWGDWEIGYVGQDLNHTIVDLLPNSWYWFRLAYVGGLNTEVWSKMTGVKTESSTPYTPKQLDFEWLREDKTKANLTWEIENDGGRPLLGYSIQAQSDLDDDFTTVYTSNDQTLHYVFVVDPGRTYQWRVNARNELGQSSFSITKSFACPPKKPGPPTLSVNSKSMSSISLQWQPPTFDGGVEITKYTLERADGLGMSFGTVMAAKQYTYAAASLFKHTVYRFRVKATNAAGDGPWGSLTVKTSRGSTWTCPGGTGDDTCFGHGSCDSWSNCTCDHPWVLGDCSGKPCPVNSETGLQCTHASKGVCDYGRGKCDCVLGQITPDCSVTDVSHLCPENCGHGTCSGHTGLCVCNSGFAGATCLELNCSGIGQCNGHGSCVDIGVCECDAGYVGEGCDKPSCFSLGDCSGGGSCVMPDTCQCDTGHSGIDCSNSLCGELDCSGHGHCYGDNYCVCSNGWQGADCEIPVCLNNCSDVGVCEEPGMCTCDEGYAGLDCSVPLCPQVDYCNGRGKCISPNVCECNEGWQGKKCTEFACSGIGGNCSGNGQCVAPLTCLCDAGWMGYGCERADCRKVHECSRHGNCTAPNTCVCAEGWMSENCGTPLCNMVKGCSGHGVCTAPQVCLCDEGFDGVECETRTLDTNTIIFPSPVESLDFQNPLLNGLAEFTVEGWFSLDGVGRRVVLFNQRDVLNVFAVHKYPLNQPIPLNSQGDPENPIIIHAEAITSAGAAMAQGEMPLSELGVWHHVAVSMSPSGLNIYVDGGNIGMGEVPHYAGGADTTSGSSDFGLTCGGGVYFSGSDEVPSLKIADFRVWSVRRAVLDYRDSMAMFLIDHVPSGSLLASLKFADAFGAYAVDTSGINPPHTARLIGMPRFERSKLPIITPPAPPELVEHIVLSDTVLQVRWQPPENDGGASVHTYILEKTEDFTTFEQVYSGPRMDLMTWGLIKGRFYGFRAYAENFAGVSEPSEVSYMGTISGVPFKSKHPVGLKENGQTNMTLLYHRPKCNGSEISSYQLQVTDPRTNMRSVLAENKAEDPRIFTVDKLLPGREYSVRVRAVNKDGEGFWSDDVQYTTNASTPSPPVWGENGGVAPAATHSVTLQFTPGSENGLPITSYEVQRKLKSMRTISPLAAAPSQPESQTERRTRVMARRALHATAAVSSSSVASSAVSLLQLSEQIEAEAGLEMMQADQSHWVDIGLAGMMATSYTDTTARPASTYYYRIRAVNDIGAGPWTSVKTETLAAPPDAPIEVQAHGTSPTSGLAVWRRPPQNGPLVMEYRADIAEAGLNPMLWKMVYNGTALSTPLEMESGILYMVRVQARNCKGWGVHSEPVAVMGLPDKPAVPVDFRATKVAGTAVSLTWTSQKLPLEVVSYTVQARAVAVVGDDGVAAPGAWEQAYAGVDTFTTVRELLPFTSYEFKVCAVSLKGGKGDFTVPVTMKTLITPPEIPVGLRVASKDANSIQVAWVHGSDNGSPITRSQVYIGHKQALTLRLAYEGKAKTARLVGLEPYQVYKIRLRVVNAEGASEYSEILGRTGPPVPSAPLQPKIVSKTGTSIKFAWEGGPDVMQAQFDDSKGDAEVDDPKPIKINRWQLAVWGPSPENHTLAEAEILGLREDNYITVYDNAAQEFDLANLKETSFEEKQWYFVRVRGIGSMGAGRWSPYTIAMTKPSKDIPVLPDAPRPVSYVDHTEDSITIKWDKWKDAAASRYNGLPEYSIEVAQPVPWDSQVDGVDQDLEQLPWGDEPRSYRIDGGAGWVGTEIWRGETPKARLNNLLPGYSYAFRLRVSTAVGLSPPSAWRVFHTNTSSPAVIEAPYLSARSATELRIEWEQPADGGADIMMYTVNIDNETSAVMPSNTTRYFVAKGLAPGSMHSLAVTVENEAGFKMVGQTGTYETLVGSPYKPDEPELVGVPVGEKVSIEVSWSYTRPAGTPVTGYTLEMRDPLLMIYIPLLQRKPKVFSYTVEHVLPGQEYAFRLIAHSAAGASEPSNAAIVVAPLVIPSEMPPLRMSGITASSVTLDWDDLTAGENEFEVRMGSDPEDMHEVSKGMAHEATITDIPSRTRFYAQVRAVNGKGNGPWSEEIQFKSESLCVGDDGSVCNGKGSCVEGKCDCYLRYSGTLCEFKTEQGLCSLWGGGHIETFDGRASILSPLTGEHVLFALPTTAQEREIELEHNIMKVHVHFRSLPDKPRVTAVDSIAIQVGNSTLSLSTNTRLVRAVNNVYTRLNCGNSLTMQVKYGFENGYSIPDSPFHVRFDAAKRFIVSVDGIPHARIIIQPMTVSERVYLSVYLSIPQSRRGTTLGLCGEYQPESEPKTLLPAWFETGEADQLWLDQWIVNAQVNLTQCPIIENPVFDTSAPVIPPAGDANMANDVDVADAFVLSALELDVVEVDATDELVTSALEVDSQLHVQGRSAANMNTNLAGVLETVCGNIAGEALSVCSALQHSAPQVYQACAYDWCVMGATEALVPAHTDARRTIAALKTATADVEKQGDDDEAAADTDGTLTNDQQPLPVCPI